MPQGHEFWKHESKEAISISTDPDTSVSTSKAAPGHCRVNGNLRLLQSVLVISHFKDNNQCSMTILLIDWYIQFLRRYACTRYGETYERLPSSTSWSSTSIMFATFLSILIAFDVSHTYLFFNTMNNGSESKLALENHLPVRFESDGYITFPKSYLV